MSWIFWVVCTIVYVFLVLLAWYFIKGAGILNREIEQAMKESQENPSWGIFQERNKDAD